MDKITIWGNRCDNIFIEFCDVYNNKIDIHTLKLNDELFGDKFKFKYLSILKQIENAYIICYNKLSEYFNNSIELSNNYEQYKNIIKKRKNKLYRIQTKILKEQTFINNYCSLVSSYINNDFDEFKKYYDLLKNNLYDINFSKRYNYEIKHIIDLSIIKKLLDK